MAHKKNRTLSPDRQSERSVCSYGVEAQRCGQEGFLTGEVPHLVKAHAIRRWLLRDDQSLWHWLNDGTVPRGGPITLQGISFICDARMLNTRAIWSTLK